VKENFMESSVEMDIFGQFGGNCFIFTSVVHLLENMAGFFEKFVPNVFVDSSDLDPILPILHIFVSFSYKYL
jgi:hypothetical protein